MSITFGKVPMYEWTDRYIVEKREGFGWNNLGPRRPKFITLHRMVGTLWGTDGWFRRPDVSSITDFGVGIQVVDGAANAGKILRWNDPTGHRSGWSSGPVNGAYGDGLCIVNKYGVNAVNRDGISLEISGTDQPIDEKSWKQIVHFCAWWIDWMKIPYTALPLNPHSGCNVLIWHNEFTNGTGKQCPFPWMRNNTNRLYKEIGEFLKPYQEGASAPSPPTPAPVPAPTGPVFHRFEEPRQFTVRGAATVRKWADRSSEILMTLPDGRMFMATGYFEGEAVSGDRRWLVMQNRPWGRIHVSGVRERI